MNVLLLAAPLFAGYMFDVYQSYVIPFSVVGVVSLLGSALFLMLGPPPGEAGGGGRNPSAPNWHGGGLWLMMERPHKGHRS